MKERTKKKARNRGGQENKRGWQGTGKVKGRKETQRKSDAKEATEKTRSP